MYTKSESKITTILAGVTGSFLWEVMHSDIITLKAFKSELMVCDSFKVYDELLTTSHHYKLLDSVSLNQVRILLQDINNKCNYELAKELLSKVNISTCGYTSAGRMITIYNSVAHLTIDCSKPTGPQLDRFINLYK